MSFIATCDCWVLSSTTLPSASTTFVYVLASRQTPSFANEAYACAIALTLTPFVRPPIASGARSISEKVSPAAFT